MGRSVTSAEGYRLPGARSRTIPRFPLGSGPRPPPWALPCATRVLAYSSARRGRISPKAPREELTTETPTSKPEKPAYEAEEPSPEEQLRQAMNTPCPIAKYKGKTLGDALTLDPRAISWVANKFTGNSQISEAAKLLCDYALEQTAS